MMRRSSAAGGRVAELTNLVGTFENPNLDFSKNRAEVSRVMAPLPGIRHAKTGRNAGPPPAYLERLTLLTADEQLASYRVTGSKGLTLDNAR